MRATESPAQPSSCSRSRQCVQSLAHSRKCDIHILLCVRERDNRVKRRGGCGVNAKFEKFMHEFAVGGAIYVLAIFSIVTNRSLLGKQQLKHGTHTLDNYRLTLSAEHL